MRRHTVTVLTAADGTASVDSPKLTGEIHSIEYVKPGAASYTDGVAFAITGKLTGTPIWSESAVNATARRAPRMPSHTTAGAAATLDGTRPALVPIAIANDNVNIAITGGGNAKTGTFHIIVK